MNRPSPAPARERASLPDLLFRAMPPSEPLLVLAREQDALCRAVHPLDASPATVAITRQGHGREVTHEVRVQARIGGLERCGSAQHGVAGIAVCAAYSELLRALVHATPCPCSQAA